MEIDDTGHAPNVLGGTQVLFDGVPASLTYTSSTEVGAVAHFGITGPTTQVQVAYEGRLSAPRTLDVVPAAPALFALDGTGGGQASILNEDGTLNSWDNPAKPGSMVSLFATGLGQTDPASEDGKITDRLALPGTLLPVIVLLNGKAVEVQYEGAAPDMVRGIFQINIKIPEAIEPGDVAIVLRAGSYISPTLVTLSVR